MTHKPPPFSKGNGGGYFEAVRPFGQVGSVISLSESRPGKAGRGGAVDGLCRNGQEHPLDDVRLLYGELLVSLLFSHRGHATN